MFTGLVHHVGRLASTTHTPTGRRLILDPTGWNHRPAPGESIAVNGVCLTVASASPTAWAFDAVHETLAKTTLGSLTPGSPLNLEHAATPITLLGGHIVQGHIDGVARVSRLQTGPDWRVEFTPPPDFMPWFIPKGCVCVEGVSLTLAAVNSRAGTFEVALIPTTLESTTLARLTLGQLVNIEADAMVKSIVHVLRNYMPPTDPRA